MDQGTIWALAGIAVVLLLTVILLVFRWWRKRQDNEDEQWNFVMDLVEKVIEAIIKETREQLADIPLETVSNAARNVYEQYIASTPAGALIPKQLFINLVMEQWQRMIGVRQLVANTHQEVMARLAASNLAPAAPSG